MKYFKPLFQILFILLILTNTNLDAQTRSRIAGRITDESTGEPLVGVNVMVESTVHGTASDINGQFIIINVPVGTYKVSARMIGYEGQVVSGIMVSADQVAKVNFALSTTVLQGTIVEVTAERHVLHKEVTNTQLTISDEQFEDASGVREINSFLSRLPGVSEDNGYLAIRGGSADQTGIMVNGISFVNAAAGNAETSIPMSAIEQVSVMSGGYNAEYGNFRSGLINVTTKSGSKSGYHGTIKVSRDQAHLRRFGKSFYDPMSAGLRPYLDPAVAFDGTLAAWEDDPYLQQQYPRFQGWNKSAENFNRGKADSLQATPLDYYLLAAWMHMAVPDYDGLLEYDSSYIVSDDQKAIFASHQMDDSNSDWNIDGGFGGPVPIIGKYFGDATFYISHNTKKQHYIQPVSRTNEEKSTTLLTIKSQPFDNLTLTLNALRKYQIGISPIRPPWGDFPDASREGGFMALDNIKYQHKNTDYWYDQPFFPILEQTTLMGGLTVNHLLSKSTFWELALSVLSIQDDSPVGNTRDSTVITRFGPFPVTEMPYGKMQYGGNVVEGYNYPSYDGLPGISRRYRRKEGDLYTDVNVTQYRAKFDLNSQVGLNNYIKGGVEYNYIDINHVLWQKWNENYYNVYEFNYHRTPSQTGIYLQDQISFENIIANIGIRFDYYDGGGGKWPSGDAFAKGAFNPVTLDSVTPEEFFEYLVAGDSYVWSQWLAYDSLNPGFLQPIKNHSTFSPRIGISFPVTERSKFYFNYGHFRSNPPYYSMYLYRYRYTKNGLYDMSNPNLEPPRTISYELGLTTNIYGSYLMKISGYSKDVTGQHGEVNYVSASSGINYDKWENNEYEDIQGVELNISKNDNSWITGWINFDYMLKKSGLIGVEQVTDITAKTDEEGMYKGQESRSLPIPKFNANITLRTPSRMNMNSVFNYVLTDWSITFFAEWKAGGYFTWNPLNELHVNNNMRWPDYKMLDMKLNKKLNIFGLDASLFVDVSNLLNIKVNMMRRGYAFQRQSGSMNGWQDFTKYMSSLKLPLYDSEDYDDLRTKFPGYYESGNDEIGDLRSDDKPYINDPNLPIWINGNPRDIWVGLSFSF